MTPETLLTVEDLETQLWSLLECLKDVQVQKFEEQTGIQRLKDFFTILHKQGEAQKYADYVIGRD